jgi:hypothetical protein
LKTLLGDSGEDTLLKRTMKKTMFNVIAKQIKWRNNEMNIFPSIELSFEDYMRLVFLIKDLKRNIDRGEIKIEDEELKQEFMNDLNYFYVLFSLNKKGE